jgi:hypothetical protein
MGANLLNLPACRQVCGEKLALYLNTKLSFSHYLAEILNRIFGIIKPLVVINKKNKQT